jgi:hypothetical protein
MPLAQPVKHHRDKEHGGRVGLSLPAYLLTEMEYPISALA